jgi:excisionase family DNA binding protein
MTASHRQRDTRTYLPDEGEAALLQELLAIRAAEPRHNRPVLSDGAGRTFELPHSVVEAMFTVAEALSSGQGVAVMPLDTEMTTQEAADYLGMSRPTLVKLLEAGEIPFRKIRRHRRV